MKKLFMLALVLTTVIASAFSEIPSNTAVLNAFHKSFAEAKNIEWTIKKDFYRAKFSVNDEVMYAYYKEDGELMAITRNITTEQLPMGLSSTLFNKHKDYYLANLFEVSANGESTYYAAIRKGNCIITLQASAAGEWKFFKKERV